MAEEFQAEVCGSGSWFMNSYGGCWQNSNNYMNMKTLRSTDEFSGGCAALISPDSSIFQMMETSPSTTTNWNGRSGESCYNQTLPDILNSSNFCMDQEESSSFMTNSCGYPSSLLQTFYDGTSPTPTPPPPPPAEQGLYNNNIQASLNEFEPAVLSMTFLNTSALDVNDNLAGFFTSKQAYEEKSKCPNIKSRNEEIRDDLGSSGKKGSTSELTTFKRPRLETPSPLPTFKVRKEKLGDRVTALQQLVSPFGKTDTASVLHEAIEYIKLLHDQINVLSNPYVKNGATMQLQQISNKVEDTQEVAKPQDLRSRGLCLVPVSSTFPVATQTAPDYWTSSLRGTFN